MPEPLRLQGQGASAGHARGIAHVLPGTRASKAVDLPTRRDREKLLVAVHDTVAALRALADSSDLQSGTILEFQIEMLMDPAIVEPSLTRIRLGESAAVAWGHAMDDYIHGFEASDDEHIRARSSDMLDIKNQVMHALNGEAPPDFPRGSVFVGPDIAPSVFLSHDWTGGGAIVLYGGSIASHVAMLARSRGVPMVVGVGEIVIESGRVLNVNGSEGFVDDDAGSKLEAINGTQTKPFPSGHTIPPVCRTADGVTITLRANIDHPAELRGLSPQGFEGIGLFRTEFLVSNPAQLLDEERQVQIYSETLSWAQGKPVTIRLFDFGADKPLPGTDIDPSSHLGLRGIRLLLARPELLRVQARAMMRAASSGQLRVLLPMVTAPSELEETIAIFTQEAAALGSRGVECTVPPVGMMIEVPAAALNPDAFRQASFFSFGTNDLAQYLGATARDSASVSHLHEVSNAATLRYLRLTAPLAEATKKPLSVCGDLATDSRALPELLACGFREFSMPPARMPLVREALSELNADGSKARD